MSDPQPNGNPPAKTGEETNAAKPKEESAANQLTPEEQLALFEKDLKENDWGHQPC
jgi:hypothetical protein